MELLFFCNRNDLSQEDYHKIVNTPFRKRRYEKDDIIALQGDPINYLYFLSKGQVHTVMGSDHGFSLYVGEIKAPFPLATAFLFAEQNRFPVEVIACEETEIILYRKQDIEQLMVSCLPFLHGFISLMGTQMYHLSERLKIFSFETIRAKLAYYILTKSNSGSFCFEHSITDLASYFGVRRQSLSREISKMIKDGIISYHKGCGQIIDKEKFRTML